MSESKIELALRTDLKAFLTEYHANAVNVSQDEKEAVERQISHIEDMMQRLDHIFEIGRINTNEYDRKITAFKAESEKLHKKIIVPQPKADSVITAGWKMMYDSLDREKKMLFWQNIITEIEIDEAQNVIFINFK